MLVWDILMSLARVSEGIYVLEGRTNVGVVLIESKECLIIDTGINRDYGRKLLNVVKNMGLNIRAVVNTHSHADHIGGNKIILEKSGALFYSSIPEKPFIELPLAEAIYLYGAYPPKVLRKHLIEAEGVPANGVSELTKEYPFLKIVELPGHSIGMIGIGVSNVLFSADAFFPDEIIEKYKVPYHLSAQEALKTLERLSTNVLRNYEVVVPSHGKILKKDEAQQLISRNIEVITSIRNLVQKNISDRITLNELIKSVLKDLALVPQTMINYLLVLSALKSYIAWLVDEGIAEFVVSDNELHVEKVQT